MEKLIKTSVFAVAIFALLFSAKADYNSNPIQDLSTPDTVQGTKVNPGCSKVASNIASSPLSAAETEGLLFMREEEKLAHDVYIAMAAIWDIPIFSNISRAETHHMQAVLSLLQKYEIKDPVADAENGIFTNTLFSEMYHSLTKQGENNLLDALRAGAFIEETDIADLRERIEQSDNEDIKMVYENLLFASYRHLRAFSKNLAFRDAAYTPQRLSQAEFDEIVDIK